MQGETLRRTDLSDGVEEYALAQSRQQGFVGLEIYTPIYVPKLNGRYTVLPVEEYLKPRETRRVKNSAFNRGSTNYKEGTYSCEEHGWEEPVDEVESKDDAGLFDQEMVATEVTVDTILRKQEADIVTIATTAANHLTAAAAVAWTIANTAKPRNDVKIGIKAIMDNTGVLADTLTMSWSLFQALMETDEFQNSNKYTSNIFTSGFDVQRAVMAAYLGVGRILVANGVQNSADEGQDYSASDLWANEFAFLSVTNTGALKSRPQAGRTFIWDQLGGNQTYLIDSYKEDQTKSDIIRAHQARDIKTVHKEAGYLITGAYA